MRWLFGRRDRDLDDEIRTHLAMAERDRIDRGEDPGAARAHARREFGNILHVAEATRADHLLGRLSMAAHDLGAVVRAGLRHPAFFLSCLGVLTLAVSLNLVVFGLVNALWLKPMPVADPDRVVVIARDFEASDGSRFSESGLDMLRRTGLFAGVAGQAVTSGDFAELRPRVSLSAIQEPLEAAWVTPEFFTVLGIRLDGRPFTRDDGLADLPGAVIISDRVARTLPGDRGDVLGLVLEAEPIALKVVGIAPLGFHGARRGERTDLWLPHKWLPRLTGGDRSTLPSAILPMLAIGRLSPGVSVDDARSALTQNPKVSRAVAPLSEVFGAADLPMIRVGSVDVLAIATLIGACVLAGGCATLVALILVYYERRGREFAVRIALGATRVRLAMQLAFELVVLAGTGAAAALWLSWLVINMLPHVRLPSGLDLNRLDLTPDWRGALAAALCCVTSLGLAGAVLIARATRSRIGVGLIAPAATNTRSSVRYRSALIGTHVAITGLVLVAAALGVQSIVRASTISAGFETERLLFATVQTRYRWRPLDEPAREARVARDIARGLKVVEQIRGLAGVRAVAPGPAPLAPEQQLRLSTGPRTYKTDGGPQNVSFAWLAVGDGYLEALGASLLAGRSGRRGEVVITAALARSLWPGETPLGKPLSDGSAPMKTVVGVVDLAVGSVRHRRQPAALVLGELTVPSMVGGSGRITLAINAENPTGLKPSIERLLSSAFPDAPLVDVITARGLLDADLGQERLAAWMFTGFGLVALILAIGSVFTLVVHLVESRWQEFAVRLALGASKGQVASAVVWAMVKPALLGPVRKQVLDVAARRGESYSSTRHETCVE